MCRHGNKHAFWLMMLRNIHVLQVSKKGFFKLMNKRVALPANPKQMLWARIIRVVADNADRSKTPLAFPNLFNQSFSNAVIQGCTHDLALSQHRLLRFCGHVFKFGVVVRRFPESCAPLTLVRAVLPVAFCDVGSPCEKPFVAMQALERNVHPSPVKILSGWNFYRSSPPAGMLFHCILPHRNKTAMGQFGYILTILCDGVCSA